MRSALLAFIEAQAWWGREGPITIEGGRAGDAAGLDRMARRDGALLADARDCRHVDPGRGGSKIGLFVARGRRRVAGRSRVGRECTLGGSSFELDIPLSTQA